MSNLSIPDLAAAVQADFVARNITAKVLFGDWNVAKHNAADHVIFGLSTFEFEAPDGQAPGPYYQHPATKLTAARSLFSRVQECMVFVHAAPPVAANDPLRAEKSQIATCDLLHATAAALFRAATGSLSIGQGEWPKPEGQQFLYGSLCTFVAKLSIPVLDDAYVAVASPNAAGSTGTTYLTIGGTNYQAAQTP